jgi:DnaK suppressor protein
MANKNPRKAQKKVSKTRQRPGSDASKKKTVKTAGKTMAARKMPKTSDKTKKTKKAIVKKPVAQTKKKVVKKKPAAAPSVSKKVVAKAPEAKPKKKLALREQRIQDIKKVLIMQRNALLDEAEEALNALPGQTIFPDMGDQASAEIDRSFMLRLRGREQRLLKKIEQAIEKIDSGAFGICDVCGEEITLKRLEARPVTNMCIFCKTEQEEEEKLRGK